MPMPESGRKPPKRTLTKKQALRHLIHAAIRMLMAREDAFATHVLIQSADKVLIDLAKHEGKKLLFEWDEFLRPEFKKQFHTLNRETFNFFKHADTDAAETLHVGEIGKLNLLQMGIVVVNYQAFYSEWTNHMRLIFSATQLMFPESFVNEKMRPAFDKALPKVEDMTLASYLNEDVWLSPIMTEGLPELASERDEDRQDTAELYNISFRDFRK